MGRVRSGLTRLRARTAGELPYGEDGFTIIEMVVAITILAIALLSLAFGIFGGMRVLQAGRHQTSFLELANAEAETIRALNYAHAGVNGGVADGVAPEPDPNLNTAYPPVAGVNKYNGRDAVIISPPRLETPPAVEVVTSSPVSDRPVPYTIRRWVTWTDSTGGTSREFKRIDITIEWSEPNGRDRSVSYNTLYYPGDLGPIEATPPVANFTMSPTAGFIASSVLPPTAATSFAFDGTPSSDPNGLLITTYEWDFGDGTAGTGLTTSHSYSSVGRKTVALVVTNSAGVESDPITRDVFVGTAPGTPAPPGNVGPVAQLTATPTSGVGPLSVSVDATASSDANGDPLTHTWTWGDGSPNGRGASSGHVYTNVGTYTLTLTVTDPAGATSVATAEISVPSLTCAVTSAYFENPSGDPIRNDIDINNQDRPENSSFVFTAVTNTSCTSLSVQLPTQAAPFTATLLLVSSTTTSKTWGLTTTNNSKYDTGASQSATFTAVGDAGAVPFSVSFSVHV